MDPDLMHAAGAGPAKDDGRLAVVRKPLEFRVAVFALWRDAADADLVADHFDGLVADDHSVTGRNTKNPFRENPRDSIIAADD